MTVLFDNNLPMTLALALRALGKQVLHVQEVSDLGAGAPDELILQHAARWDYTLLTRDRAMTRTPQYRAIILSQRIGVVIVRTGHARQLRAWEIAKLIIAAWDGIEERAANVRRPFLHELQTNGRLVAR